MKRTIQALCAVLTVGLMAAGCAQTSAAGGSDGPIKLMVMSSLTGVLGVDQTLPHGAEAAAESINAAGGVNGRTLQIITCDTASDPNKSTECARKANSEGVSAVVGAFDPIGIAASLPVLRAANIPYLGPLGTMPVEFSSSNSFPTAGGAPAAVFGMVAAALDNGCKRVGTFGDPAADSGTVANFVKSVQKAGMDAFMINLPTNVSDPTPQVAQLLERQPDCVAFSSSGQTAVQLFSAIRRSGSSAKLFSAPTTLLPPLLKALGPDAEGIIGVSDLPAVSDPELKPFLDDMGKYQPNVAISGFPLQSWSSVRAFAQIADGMADLSPAAVLAKLGTTTDLKLPGRNPIDFTKLGASQIYPREFHPYVEYNVVKNGEWATTDNAWKNIAQYTP